MGILKGHERETEMTIEALEGPLFGRQMLERKSKKRINKRQERERLIVW